jgi:oligoribonuclease NrnB/cAMP/cGMP phosphodiesterase (DHH superfamily)
MTAVVFYHANCTDGFGAAFSAWKVLKQNAEYIPIKYGQINSLNDVDLLGKLEGRDVFILDFSFPLEVMNYILGSARHVTWLDHHKTAFEMWVPEKPFADDSFYEFKTPTSYILLDNSRSGARIAWDHFVGDEVPRLIMHIDDYDRWQFKNSNTKAFGRALRAMEPWSFDQWENKLNWAEHGETYLEIIELGQALLDDHSNRVKNALKSKRACIIPTADSIYAGAAVNAGPDMASDVGHELAKETGTFGLVYYIGSELTVKCSFRSNGAYDVSKLAKHFGGGGHKNAAGAEISVTQLLHFLGG